MQSKSLAKLKKFFKKHPETNFVDGDTVIFLEDDPGHVHYLSQGFVRQCGVSSGGVEVLYHIYTPDSFFPLTWAIADIPNRHCFTSIGNSVIYKVKKEAFLSFVKNDSELLMEINKRILQGLDGLLTRTELLTFGSGFNRVASTIYYLSRHFGKRRQNKVVFETQFTHQDIASFAGLARETTTLELKKLKEEGVISYNKRFIEIRNLKKLREALDVTFLNADH